MGLYEKLLFDEKLLGISLAWEYTEFPDVIVMALWPYAILYLNACLTGLLHAGK
ncbi:hypothetical protein [Butyrivibrio sp. JL13D10]|uniref:hypothetical protein n=1 Tax=Butyrivibrio sp. JL13D10 TaxID=3236815 RepID=UPI0038B41AD0